MMANHFPIKGQHSKYSIVLIFFSIILDEKISNTAQKCLMKGLS